MAPNPVEEELIRLRQEYRRLESALITELATGAPKDKRCAYLRSELRAVMGAVTILERVRGHIRAVD